VKKNIVFLDSSTFPDHLKFNKIKFPHTWKNHKTTSPSEVINRIKKAHIIVNNKVDLGSRRINICKKIRVNRFNSNWNKYY
jgi:glycerate dehydrogenase